MLCGPIELSNESQGDVLGVSEREKVVSSFDGFDSRWTSGTHGILMSSLTATMGSCPSSTAGEDETWRRARVVFAGDETSGAAARVDESALRGTAAVLSVFTTERVNMAQAAMLQQLSESWEKSKRAEASEEWRRGGANLLSRAEPVVIWTRQPEHRPAE